MTGLPGCVPPPARQSQIHWETSGSFTVEWLNTHTTRFFSVGNLDNIFNRNEDTGEVMSVIVGRDGQEIEGGCGSELCRIMDEEALTAAEGAQERDRKDDVWRGNMGTGPNGKRYREAGEEVGGIRSFRSGNYARAGYGGN
jgi:hypothetical protein